MTSNHYLFHTSGLRQEQIEPGPGQLMVVLREPIVLEGGDPGLDMSSHLRLGEGDILHAEVNLLDVREAISEHLQGTVLQSELRFGVGVLLGFEPAMRFLKPLDVRQESAIDEWLDRYTVFAIMRNEPSALSSIGQYSVGLFNGIRHHWIDHWRGLGAAH